MDSRYYARVPDALGRESAAREFMAKVYGWMGLGLGLTALVAMVTVQSPALLKLVVVNPILRFGLIIAQLGLVFYLSARISKMSVGTATGVFLTYAGLSGLTFSVIFLIYTAASIASTFFITAGTFAAMSVIGYTTKRDLTSMGSFLMMGLIGLIIASLVNMFLQSSMLQWMLSVIGVLIFVGLTAYDTQKIKNMAAELDMRSDMAGKAAVMGALTLYLDFINLFLY